MTDRAMRGWCAAIVLAAVGQLAHGLTLVQDGRRAVSVYVAKDDDELTRQAATELAEILGRMSGAKFAVVEAEGPVAPGGPAIVLGALAGKLTTRSPAGDGFRYRVVGKRLLIAGESAQGVYSGVYDFLESLGCGWFTPGPMGEVIPRRPTIIVPDNLDHAEASDSISRRFWYGGKSGRQEATTAWRRRNKVDLRTGSWVHAWRGLVNPKEHFAEHPEYFSLNRGKRSQRQLCTTNPGTVQIAAATLMKRMEPGGLRVYAAGPNDGGNLCECAPCAQLDTPGYVEPSSGKPVCSTRIFKFAGDVAAITSKRFPDADLGILVYSEYSRVPKKLERLHPNVFPMIAPIRRCRFHGPGNPVCLTNQLWQEEIRGWGQRSKKLGFYVYNYNLADTLVPLSKVSFYKRLLAEVHRLDIDELAWVFETIDSWAMHAPHLYLSVRLAWNSRLDVDAEMERFFQGFYAEAADPMRRYWARIDEAYAGTNTHTGSQYGLHRIWTEQLLADSRRDIDAAGRLAKSDRAKQAVAMAAAGLRCAELFIGIHRGVMAFDFAQAKKAQDELQAHVDMMAAKPAPHWAHQRYAFGYYQRFSGRTVEGGARIIKAGGKIVVAFPDRWQFRQDADGVGVDAGWFKPDASLDGWRDIQAYSRSWADYGLEWYQGDAWYRAAFTVPAAAKGKTLALWFGGFDHNADVYLNGQHVGEQRGFATPREFTDIGRYLEFAGDNVLVVRVSAGGLAELGTGGIMKPVMIYQVRDKAAPEKKSAKGTDYQM